MSFLNQIVSEKIIGAMGWTLFHSLWQGAIIASVFVLLMVLTRRYRPQIRYLIGVASLLLMFTVSTVTFFTTLNSGTLSKNNAIHNTPISPATKFASGDTVAVNNNHESRITLLNSMASFFKDYFKEHLPLIVTIWLLGILLYVLRFTGGFIYKKRFKTRGVNEPPEFWQKRFMVLCERMGVTRSIRFMESSIVKVPILMGHLKPVILFPASLISGLPQGQVEVLLVHELAHILRKDFLINILQHVFDILYFYHPGIRWISTMVRHERENCCDDIAISITGNTVNYAKALTNIYSINQKIHGTILAITGTKNKLLNRIKRILYRSKRGSKFTEGFIAASILCLCILTVASTANWSVANDKSMIPNDNSTKISSEKIVSKIYILKDNSKVEIKGKTDKKSPSIQKANMVDYNTGRLVWTLKEQLLRKETKGFSFKDTIFLKKGCYQLNGFKTLTLSLKLTNKSKKTTPILVNVDALERYKDRILTITGSKEAERMKQEQLALEKAIPIKQKLEEKHLKRAIPIEGGLEEKQLKKGKPIKDELTRKIEEEQRIIREVYQRQKQHEIQERQQEHLKQKQLTEEQEHRRQVLEMLGKIQKEKNIQEELYQQKELALRENELLRRREENLRKYIEILNRERMAREEREKRGLTEELERLKMNKESEEWELMKRQEKSTQKELGLQLEELKQHGEELTRRLAEEKKRLGLMEQKLQKELAVVASIKKELLKDKLIKNEREFEFKISLKGMFINGKKQSGKIFKKYKKIYESKSGKNLETDRYVKIIDEVN